MRLICRDRIIGFPRRPLVMGIINVNDDSFSGDGTLDVDKALDRAAALVRAGADIIDVGGESARTNREAISGKEEIRRVLPFIGGFKGISARNGWTIRDAMQLDPPLLSINTWRPEVAEALLRAGGDILNDMGGLPDNSNAVIAARHGAALLIMHSVGEPKVAHDDEAYEDVVAEVARFFGQKMRLAGEAGLEGDSIILDPGLDFAKGYGDSLAIMAGLEEFKKLGRPILLPISRKTFIGRALGIENPAERDAGTIACLVNGLNAGIQIFRVHNVDAAYTSCKVIDAVRHA